MKIAAHFSHKGTKTRSFHSFCVLVPSLLKVVSIDVQPLCPLCLRGSLNAKKNHRGTEDTEVAQRKNPRFEHNGGFKRFVDMALRTYLY